MKEWLGGAETHLPADKSCLFPTAWWTPSLTYCLVLIHPKHECVRNPLFSYPSECSVSVQPDLDFSVTNDSVMYLQSILTPSLWLLRGLGKHWTWFGQTRIWPETSLMALSHSLTYISYPFSSRKCLQHQMRLAFLIQTDHNLWKDTSELLSLKYQTLNWYTLSGSTCVVLNPAILSESFAKNSHRSSWTYFSGSQYH